MAPLSPEHPQGVYRNTGKSRPPRHSEVQREERVRPETGRKKLANRAPLKSKLLEAPWRHSPTPTVLLKEKRCASGAPAGTFFGSSKIFL